MQEDHGIVLRQVFGLECLVENISYPQRDPVVDDQVLPPCYIAPAPRNLSVHSHLFGIWACCGSAIRFP